MNLFNVILFFIFSCSYCFGQQHIGSPHIINYNSAQYKAGMQNWDIAQDRHGIMYFANNEGLLTFNGHYWKLYPLPNPTVVRTVAITNDNRIYVGGQDELGCFSADSIGVLKYHSLIELIPIEERLFADVWDIVTHKNEVFFRTNTKIFHYRNNHITIDKPLSSWQFLGKVEDALFAQDAEHGLFQYDGTVWKPLVKTNQLKSSPVTAIMPYHADTLLVSTLKLGVFYIVGNEMIPKMTGMDEIFTKDRIYCATSTGKSQFILGTTSAGVMVIDRNGRRIRQYEYGEGLQKNNVRSVFVDRHRNLWIALDDGIDFIALNSSIKYIEPSKTNPISSYAMRIYNEKLYVGTSNGLYVSPIDMAEKDLSSSNARFTKVEGTEGQVWGLQEVNGQLLMAHEDGGYVLQDKGIKSLMYTTGTWLFNPLSRVLPSRHILAGTYVGLQRLSFDKESFQSVGHVHGLDESLRFIHYDSQQHAIWASHPYRGVYLCHLSSDGSRIVTENIRRKGRLTFQSI